MLLGIFYAITSAVCFGFLAIFGKYGTILHIPAGDLLTYRFLVGSILFAIFFILKDITLFKIDLKNFIKAAITGGVFYLLQSFCFFKALEYIPASTTSLILYIYPLTVAILSKIIFKTRININMIFSLILIAIGCSLIFYDAFSRRLDLKGISFAVSAMLIFSTYLIFVQKTLRGINPITYSFYVILTTGITFSIFNSPIEIVTLNGQQLILAILIGIIPTFLAIALQFIAIEKIGSVYTSIFSTVEPVVTVFASYLFLGDNIVIFQISGMFAIIIGIILPNLNLIRRGLNG